MKSSWRRILSVLLTVAMVLSLTTPVFAANSDGDKGETLDVTWEKVENYSSLKNRAGSKKAEEPTQAEPQFAPEDVVRVSIFLEGKSTMEKGYKISGISKNSAAKNYRQQLRKEQETVANRISEKVLDGKKLDVVWNLTLAANAISANVEYGKIDAIRNIVGVRNVVLEAKYEADVVSKDELDPNMSVASGMTGGQYAWTSGYTGAGTAVAIVDTGLDLDHQSFDAGAFDHAISQIDGEVDLITKSDIAAVLADLNASDRYEGLTADDLYRSTKVPYAFNYVDGDLDVIHVNDTQGEHGSHVAGITAANRYIPSNGAYKDAIEAVLTQGEAPDAQILVMKVFGRGGGAYDADYMAAIEDSIVLGAASTNLSLGSAASGLVTSEDYQDVLDGVANTDLVLVMSAGNSYSWPQYTTFGYLYSEDKNFDRVGSPGSYTNTLAVASVDNDGSTGPYFIVNGERVYYTETSGYTNAEMVTLAGDYEYVYVDGIGADVDEDDNYILNQFEGLDLTGKIAVTNRGTSSFYVKANAAVEAGAKGVIIANNQPGTISMNLTGYLYKAPVVSITLDDAEYLKTVATKTETINGVDVYYGNITVGTEAAVVHYNDRHYSMSDFSSWGVPGDLSLKPEITAPGGNIYSVFGKNTTTTGAVTGGSDKYENMSGTSMAAPQITGLAAVMAQYIAENDLVTKTGLTVRQLTNSLLMSTAEPILEEQGGSYYYYSILKQGAGLVRIDKAINSRTFIKMDADATASAADGKIKAELGEVGKKFSIGFTVYNTTGEDLDVALNSDFFTQDVFPYYTYDYNGKAILDADGNPVISEYLDTWTVPIDSSVKWLINGTEMETPNYDINGDGEYDEDDASDLLSYVVGNITDTTGWNLGIADVDADGDVDTYDAYLVLNNLVSAYVTIPANGSIHVDADVAVKGMDDYENGNYVEGYIYAEEAASEDGALGVSHSIPVIGYYGDWSASPMFDKGSYLEYYYGSDEVRDPYMSVALKDDAKIIEAFFVNVDGDDYYLGGNPLIDDTNADGEPIYLPERNAISGTNALSYVRYSQLRNAGAARFAVTDDKNNTVFEKLDGASYGSYYYVNGQAWYSTYAEFDVNYKAATVDNGTRLTYSYTLAPEYYVGKDGSVDWSKLSENATISIEATVDKEAPEVKSMSAIKTGDINEAGEKFYTYDLSLEFLDDQYIAAFTIMDEANYKAMVKGQAYNYITVQGSDVEAAKNEVYSFDLSYTDTDVETPDQLMVEVYDYAMNVTSYKVNLTKKAQLNNEDNYSIEFVNDDILIVGNSSKQLEWLVDPWGLEEVEGYSISFESSDETIATVDENGVVTSVATDDSECTITATISYKDFTASAECHVLIKFIDRELNAVIWDEKGTINFSRFNLKSLPDYERLSERVGGQIASVAVDPWTGVTYAASFDSEEYVSSLYTVDPEDGYKLTKIGDSEIGYMDIAPAPYCSYAYDTEYLMAVYGYYVVIVDATTGDYLGVFNLGNYGINTSMVGIAYEGTFSSQYGYLDYYFLVDVKGNLYGIGILPYNGSFANFSPDNYGNLGFASDTPYFNSLYLYYTEAEEEDADPIETLVWSCFNKGKGVVDIILFNDIYGDESLLDNIGSFNKNVWPVGGIYEPVEMEEESSEMGAVKELTGKHDKLELDLESKLLTKIEPIKHEGKSAVKGGTNAVKVVPSSERPNGVAEPSNGKTYNADEYTIITADENTHNGLIEITYDPSKIDIYPDYFNASYFVEYADIKIDEANGKITIGFIDSSLIVKDDIVAVILAGVNEQTCEAEMTFDTVQINNGKGQSVTVPYVEHIWSDPSWNWSEDLSSATASFTCAKCGKTETVEAKVTVDGFTYTAEAEFEGETYTDVISEENIKFRVKVSSESTETGIGSVTGTVFGDYTAQLAVRGENVNVSNVTVGLWLQDVASLGIEGLHTFSKTINTGAPSRDVPTTTVANLFKAIGTDGNTKIIGKVGDKSVTYTFKQTDEDGFRFVGTPSSESDASAVWHALINEDTVESGAKDEDSYIVLAKGSKVQLGKTVLEFEEGAEDLKIDNIADIAAVVQAARDSLKLTEAEDSKITFTLTAGTELAVGSSYAKLSQCTVITVDIADYEADGLGSILTALRDAQNNEEILKAAVNGIGSIVDAIGGKTTTVTFEIGHAWGETTYTWADDNSTVTATRVCGFNDTHVETETVEAVYEIVNDANCTEPGTGKYTATFENTAFAVQTKEVEIPAKGHTPGEPVIENETETTADVLGGHDEVVYCTVCQAELSRTHIDDVVTIDAPVIESLTNGEVKGGITVKWTADSKYTKFRIERKDGATGEWKAVSTAATGTSYVDKKAENGGTEYFYRVSGWYAGTWQAASEEASLIRNPFKDVKENVSYFKALMWAYNNGIVAGTSSTTFAPNDNCTRGQFALMLWRMNGKPDTTGLENPFKDVGSNNGFLKGILWCNYKKIAVGTSATTFSPNDNITRWQMILMLWRMEDKPASSLTENPFEDVKTTASYYKAALWAYENKITGVEKFMPNDNCTRWQLVLFLYRVNNLSHYVQDIKAAAVNSLLAITEGMIGPLH